jgi:triosephosphate isomerase
MIMEIKKPVLFINLKTYEEGTGNEAVKIAKAAEAVSREHNAEIIIVAQATDIRLISENTSLKVFAQHTDPVVYGSNTGHILPEALKKAGAVGTVLNHAENRRGKDFIEKAVKRAGEIGLNVMVCAEDIEKAAEIAAFKPDLIAVEPPELIGGEVSVSSAKPEIISGAVEKIKEISPEISVITGAGIKGTEDVEKALELGSAGVFVASGIVKADEPKKAIEGMVAGFAKVAPAGSE